MYKISYFCSFSNIAVRFFILGHSFFNIFCFFNTCIIIWFVIWKQNCIDFYVTKTHYMIINETRYPYNYMRCCYQIISTLCIYLCIYTLYYPILFYIILSYLILLYCILAFIYCYVIIICIFILSYHTLSYHIYDYTYS